MKKLKLTSVDLGSKEVLTRGELKKIIGGEGSGGGGQTCTANCGGYTRVCYGNSSGGCSAADNSGCSGHDSNGVAYFNKC